MSDNTQQLVEEFDRKYAKVRAQILCGLIRLRKPTEGIVYYLEGFDDVGDLDGYDGITLEELERDYETYQKEAYEALTTFAERLAKLLAKEPYEDERQDRSGFEVGPESPEAMTNNPPEDV